MRKEAAWQQKESAEKVRKKKASTPITCDTYKALSKKLSSNSSIQIKTDTLHKGTKDADHQCQ